MGTGQPGRHECVIRPRSASLIGSMLPSNAGSGGLGVDGSGASVAAVVDDGDPVRDGRPCVSSTSLVQDPTANRTHASTPTLTCVRYGPAPCCGRSASASLRPRGDRGRLTFDARKAALSGEPTLLAENVHHFFEPGHAGLGDREGGVPRSEESGLDVLGQRVGSPERAAFLASNGCAKRAVSRT